jgi:hypothetical protein
MFALGGKVDIARTCAVSASDPHTCSDFILAALDATASIANYHTHPKIVGARTNHYAAITGTTLP